MTPLSYEYDMGNPLVYNNEMGRYKTERQLTFIRSFLSRNPMRVLDIGGGSGRLAIPIADLGHRVTVSDNSPEAIDLLRARAGDRIDAIQSDIFCFDASEPFDIALAIDMVKYVSAPLSSLFAKANSLLSPRGLLLIAEINRNSWRNHLSILAGRRRKHRYNIASPNGYAEALKGAGFQIERMTGFVLGAAAGLLQFVTGQNVPEN